MPNTDSANASSVTPMVSQRQRMQKSSTPLKPAKNQPRLSCACFILSGKMVTPSSGVNSTATIHEVSSDTAITTNSVKVNSPAALLLRPIGMKPATVTSVPVSIGNAVEV